VHKHELRNLLKDQMKQSSGFSGLNWSASEIGIWKLPVAMMMVFGCDVIVNDADAG